MLFGYSLSLHRYQCKQNSSWKRTLQRCIMGCLWIVAQKFYATLGSQCFVDIYHSIVSNNVDNRSGLQRLPCWTHLLSSHFRQARLGVGLWVWIRDRDGKQRNFYLALRPCGRKITLTIYYSIMNTIINRCHETPHRPQILVFRV